MQLMLHWKKRSSRKTPMRSTTNQKSNYHLRYEIFLPFFLIDDDDDDDDKK